MWFSCFCVLPGSAEAQAIWGGIVKLLLVAYFIGNISAEKISKSIHVCQVIARQRWDVFETQCALCHRVSVNTVLTSKIRRRRRASTRIHSSSCQWQRDPVIRFVSVRSITLVPGHINTPARGSIYLQLGHSSVLTSREFLASAERYCATCTMLSLLDQLGTRRRVTKPRRCVNVSPGTNGSYAMKTEPKFVREVFFRLY